MLNVDALSGNLGKGFELYQNFKSNKKNDPLTLFEYMAVTGRSIGKEMQKWENALENGGDGIEGNTLSLDKYYEKDGVYYFQSKDGNIVSVSAEDASVDLYDSEDEIKALYTELNGGVSIDDFDNINWGSNSLSFNEFTFEDGAENSKAGLYNNEKLDLTNANGRSRILDVINDYAKDHDGIEDLRDIFGYNEEGKNDNVLYNADNDGKASMTVIQDGRMFTIDYDKETGEVIFGEVNGEQLAELTGVSITNIEFYIDDNDKINSNLTSESDNITNTSNTRWVERGQAAAQGITEGTTTLELVDVGITSTNSEQEMEIDGFAVDGHLTNLIHNYQNQTTTTVLYTQSSDPLVFDMDGDGVEATAGMGVDINGDGIADGAATGGDKMLAMGDLNGNGVIDGEEVFGDQTINPFTGEKLNAANGFEALRLIAEEAESRTGINVIENGVVSIQALNEAFGKFENLALGLISDGNITELESLGGIASVDVENYTEHEDGGTDTEHLQRGTFTDIFGNVHQVDDVWFS
ncbi:MAG: hypothetical protein PHV68_06500 [Candidatus Gastranaerophilales bacterium]|nr:hypothetical protein [Candidatus Gastranaerophilales bacterium]